MFTDHTYVHSKVARTLLKRGKYRDRVVKSPERRLSGAHRLSADSGEKTEVLE